MAKPRKYPWPEDVGGECVIPAPDRPSRQRLQSQAHNFAYDRRMVYRTHWDGVVVRVRRVA